MSSLNEEKAMGKTINEIPFEKLKRARL